LGTILDVNGNIPVVWKGHVGKRKESVVIRKMNVDWRIQKERHVGKRKEFVVIRKNRLFTS